MSKDAFSTGTNQFLSVRVRTIGTIPPRVQRHVKQISKIGTTCRVPLGMITPSTKCCVHLEMHSFGIGKTRQQGSGTIHHSSQGGCVANHPNRVGKYVSDGWVIQVLHMPPNRTRHRSQPFGESQTHCSGSTKRRMASDDSSTTKPTRSVKTDAGCVVSLLVISEY